MSDEVEIKVQGKPREDLIKTAVAFLSNPNVYQSAASQKEAFLQKKGLTTEEIRIAFERSRHQISNIVTSSEFGVPVQTVSSFQTFKNFIHTLALLISATYGLHYLYKNLVEPFLFGKPKKPSTLESDGNINQTAENSILVNLNDLKSDMQRVQCELDKVIALQNDYQNNSRQISDIKTEIATVKGILLSRHQFSTVNLSGPSIPVWQLSRSTAKDEKENLEEVEQNSGSSETEIVPNPNSNGGSQGSDSSLEMIKEVDT